MDNLIFLPHQNFILCQPPSLNTKLVSVAIPSLLCYLTFFEELSPSAAERYCILPQPSSGPSRSQTSEPSHWRQWKHQAGWLRTGKDNRNSRPHLYTWGSGYFRFHFLADQCNATFGYCHNMSSVICLSSSVSPWRECIMTKRLKLGSCSFH